MSRGRTELALALAAVAAGVVGIADLAIPLRSVLVVGFLMVGPGAALVRIIDIRNAPTAIAVAIAASVAIDTAIATFALYAGLWSPQLVLAVVVGLTLMLTLVALRPVEREPGEHQRERAA